MLTKSRLWLAGLVLLAASLACDFVNPQPGPVPVVVTQVVIVTRAIPVTQVVPVTQVAPPTRTAPPPAPPAASETPLAPSEITVTPAAASGSETPPASANTPMSLLWLDNCDPRTDANICHHSSDLKVFEPFYGVLDSLNATLTYQLPNAETELDRYEVVIANFCGSAAQDVFRDRLETYMDWLKTYVAAGGSVIVMGDNFCQGVGKVNGQWVSSAEAANLVTQDWGITVTADDEMTTQWTNTPSLEPLAQNVTRLYSMRHAFLTVHMPSEVVASLDDRAFVGLYAQTGTAVVIPDVLFYMGEEARPEVANSDNFVFWRNLLAWLAEQARAKHK